MEPTDDQAERLRSERLNDAAAMTFEQRFLAGASLFDYACEISKSGIRMQNPHFTDGEVMAELRRRIRTGQRVQEAAE